MTGHDDSARNIVVVVLSGVTVWIRFKPVGAQSVLNTCTAVYTEFANFSWAQFICCEQALYYRATLC